MNKILEWLVIIFIFIPYLTALFIVENERFWREIDEYEEMDYYD